MDESKKGHIHIITQAIDDITRIMAEIGFSAVTGPEAESDFYNFDALNFPKDHPHLQIVLALNLAKQDRANNRY